MTYSYRIEACRYTEHPQTDEEMRQRCDIDRYFEIRKAQYVNKWGPSQEFYYGTYPTEHDLKEGTVFLIFKLQEIDAETGNPKTGAKETVFGGRRITFSETPKLGELPFEGKHEIASTNGSSGNNSHPSYLDEIRATGITVANVVPAVQFEQIKFAEFGAYAIDQGVTGKMFSAGGKFDKSKYKETLLADIYETSCRVAREGGANIAFVEANSGNLKHQHEWLQDSTSYEHATLGSSSHLHKLLNYPFPKGNESRLLLINLDNKFKLMGPEGILRFRQNLAHAARNSVKTR